MLYHPLSIAPAPWRERVAFDAVINAHAAVILFFVLSGYVLQATLAQRPQSPISFYVRRAFRIYPAVITATAFALLVVSIMIAQVPKSAGWLSDELMVRQLAGIDLALCFLAVSSSLITPLWTVIVEIVGSACMPLISFAGRNRIIGPALVIVLAVMSPLLMNAEPLLLASLGYLVNFAVGAGIYRITPGLQDLALRRPRLTVLVMVGAAIGLLFSRLVVKLLVFHHLTPLVTLYYDPWLSLIETIWAGLLIAAIVACPNGVGVLRIPFAMFLGDISFSVYLLHYPVMLAVASGLSLVQGYDLGGAYAPVVLALLTAAVTIPLAGINFRLIEKPGIALGRAFSSLAGRPAPAQA